VNIIEERGTLILEYFGNGENEEGWSANDKLAGDWLQEISNRFPS
jgi:hypothetical protein